VGVARRMPTIPSDSGPFALGEESWLSTAVDAGAPGQGTANEVWLSARNERAAASARQRRPFAGLVVSSRSRIEHQLATDPLAHATALALGAAAVVALLLAVLGFWVGILSELRDERSDFFDLEVQGVAPRGLRAQLRVRALMLIALGLAGGVCLGLLLSRLVVSLVRISATTGFPERLRKDDAPARRRRVRLPLRRDGSRPRRRHRQAVAGGPGPLPGSEPGRSRPTLRARAVTRSLLCADRWAGPRAARQAGLERAF